MKRKDPTRVSTQAGSVSSAFVLSERLIADAYGGNVASLPDRRFL